MSRQRFHRHFRELEKRALLGALRECRKACNDASSSALFERKDVYAGCHVVQAAIDDLAGILTGDREYFWGKSLTSPPTGLKV